MIAIAEIVRCELCGRRTWLADSERQFLLAHPHLTIACEQCVEAFHADPAGRATDGAGAHTL